MIEIEIGTKTSNALLGRSCLTISSLNWHALYYRSRNHPMRWDHVPLTLVSWEDSSRERIGWMDSLFTKTCEWESWNGYFRLICKKWWNQLLHFQTSATIRVVAPSVKSENWLQTLLPRQPVHAMVPNSTYHHINARTKCRSLWLYCTMFLHPNR